MDAPDVGEPGDKTRLVLLFSGGSTVEFVHRLPPDGYDVISCPLSTAMDGWLEDLPADLVLLDPPVSPRELVATCEAVRARTECPIVVLSECNEELLITQALATGIDEYLALPIGERELAARLKAILRRGDRFGAAGGHHRVGGLVLSAAEHSVEFQGRRIFLSPIEFRLLTCLTSAPDKVLTHQTLMSRVWGAEYVDSRHYLRVYIRYLREKLEEDPTDPHLILNEWGVGYRFRPPAPATA